MKISVVIPVYNEERYIGTCLKHVFSQKVPADEVIVVDNNCTDKTIEIAKRFPVKIVKEEQQGMIWARNRGYDEAKYEVIARTDADTRVPNDWIEKIKKDFEHNRGIDGLTGPIIFYEFWPKIAFPSIVFLKVMKLIQSGETFIGPNMALTKKIWERVKDGVCLDDNKVHEDIDLALNILKVGGRILYDYSLVTEISARRIKTKPFSFLFEYPIRTIKTIRLYKKII